MRGWIMRGHGTGRPQLCADDSLQLVQRAAEIVVHDLVLELRFEGELALGDVQPLLDLAFALGRAYAEPALELLGARSGDEDRHGRRNAVPHPHCPAGLDLEQRRVLFRGDSVELGPERSGPVALPPGQLDPLEELAGLEPAAEILLAQEVVVAGILLVGAAWPRRRRDRELELGHTFREGSGQGALALAGGAGDDEDRSNGGRAQ